MRHSITEDGIHVCEFSQTELIDALREQAKREGHDLPDTQNLITIERGGATMPVAGNDTGFQLILQSRDTHQTDRD